MKQIIFFILVLILASVCRAQDRNDMPAVNIKTLDGKWIMSDTIQNDNKPMIVSFWATWCKPCIKELNAINENLPDWKEQIDFNMIAISIDDSRSVSYVAPFVKGRAWKFTVFLDTNGDLKRALNINDIPHTFLFDGNGKIIWQHTTYAEGDEEIVFEKLQGIKNQNE